MALPDVPEDLEFRHSLRVSLARREGESRRRRRRVTGRRGLVVSLICVAFTSSGALAQEAGSDAIGVQSDMISAVQAKLGVAADGINGPQTRTAVRSFQARNGLVVDGIVGPQTLAALGISSAPAAQPSLDRTPPQAVDQSKLASIAQCESDGNPAAISSDGRYRGKYQFTRSSWRAVGGAGDPAAATETEQDERAVMLMAKQGQGAWPVCSRQA